MSELLENLSPGTLPHYFVILTLANFAQADGKNRPGENIKDFNAHTDQTGFGNPTWFFSFQKLGIVSDAIFPEIL